MREVLNQLWLTIIKLLGMINQSVDTASKGLNAVDAIITVAEESAVAFRDDERAKRSEALTKAKNIKRVDTKAKAKVANAAA